MIHASPASIPSPSSGSIQLGPLNVHAYGLMIALGVVAAVWLLGRRLERKGIGTRDDANSMAVWAVLAGVVGSRIYHVLTDWEKFFGKDGHPENIPKIWQGGLGIPGGLIAGVAVGAWYMRRKGIPLGLAMNAAAPALALAQAIGRWGNYFHHELFGKPTTLPWGLEIDAANRPERYRDVATFQPTFLYESLGNFLICGVLLFVDRRFKVRPGHLFAMYVIGYGALRFVVEGLRIDEAKSVGGLRWNQWVALAAVIGGAIYLVVTRAKPAFRTLPAVAVPSTDTDASAPTDDDEREPADDIAASHTAETEHSDDDAEIDRDDSDDSDSDSGDSDSGDSDSGDSDSDSD